MKTAIYEVQKIYNSKDRVQQYTLEKMQAEYELAKKIAEIEYKNKLGPGAFGRGMTKGLFAMEEKIDTFYYTLGQDLPQQFSNSMSSALMKAVREGGKLKDVLLDAATSFLDAFNTRMMSHFMDQFAYNMFGSMQVAGKNKGGVIGRNQGGKIPTMLTSGEYVMNRGAVNQWGEGGMNALNEGTIPKRLGGGAMLAMGVGSALMLNWMGKNDE